MRRRIHLGATTWALAALLLTSGACSSDDDGGAAPVQDAGADGSGDEPTGPTDAAEQVVVEVPAAPRAFAMGAGVPADGLGTDVVDSAWNRVDGRADAIAIWLDQGLPWTEIIAGDPLPAEYDAWLADVATRANGLGVDAIVVIDWLNPQRNGLARDALGRDVPGVALTDPALQAGLAAFAGDLAGRFNRLEFLIAVVEPNLIPTGDSAMFDAVLQTYREMRNAAQDAGANNVFPLWDFDTLRDTYDNDDVDGLSRITRFDERLDRFAVSLVPSRTFTGVSTLADDELAFLSELTTRPLAVVGASYPAEGFVTGGEAFASSENSQYNFLAWLAASGDRYQLDLVVWRLLMDPNDLLRDPCAGNLPGCDVDDVTRRYAPYASSGLIDDDGGTRPAAELWRNYLARPHN